MIKAVLGYPVASGRVLLGIKKRGFGKGKINGFGGKLEANETFEQAMLREAEEEISIKPEEYFEAAELSFYDADSLAFFVKAFIIRRWEGTPRESDELKPFWVSIDALPFTRMWEDDVHWLPAVLSGRKLNAKFWYKDLFGDKPKMERFVVE